MLVLALVGVLLLVIGGCVCVFRAARGDAPRWMRGVAKATLLTGELARIVGRNSHSQQSGDGDG